MRVTLFLPLALFLASPHAASAFGAVPSLCKPTEAVLANARVLRIDKASSGNPSEGKTVSLCTDRDEEPFRKLIYRFGTPSAIEAEIVASTEKKAGIYMQSDSGAHVGVIAIVFYAKPYSYVVSEAFAMGNGLRLLVYKHSARVAEFSLLDYESKITTIDSDAPKSPVFKRVQPIEPL